MQPDDGQMASPEQDPATEPPFCAGKRFGKRLGSAWEALGFFREALETAHFFIGFYEGWAPRSWVLIPFL